VEESGRGKFATGALRSLRGGGGATPEVGVDQDILDEVGDRGGRFGRFRALLGGWGTDPRDRASELLGEPV
jgi:hypothetical protein